MNFLNNRNNIDDDHSDEELDGLCAGVEPGGNAGMAADVQNVGRDQAAVPNIPVPQNGGMSQRLPWTGGSRATRTSRSILKTGLCFRNVALLKTVFLRCEKGVDDGWMIKSKPTVPLSSSSVKIKDGLMALGMEAVFEVDTAHGLVNLFIFEDGVM